MNKSAIQKFAVQARKDLIEQVKQQAYNYGIDENGYGEKNAIVVNGITLSNEKIRQRTSLIIEIEKNGFEHTMEQVAYTWFNRFIALRFMEVNDYLPTHVRVFSDANGAFKPEILKYATQIELTDKDDHNLINKEKVFAYLDDAEGTEDLYRYLLLTQCKSLHYSLPKMFSAIGIEDYTELLLPLKILSDDSVIAHMVNDIEEEDFKDAVQIIGWLYQFYNTEPKDKVFANLKKNIKISKENIPAATQLFTPDWIVRYMVENSLGRIAVDKFDVDPASMGWKYYLKEAKQTEEVQNQLAIINTEKTTLEELKIIDPCMGSGHILVYAFDVLVQIYESQGYTARDAVSSILENNLFGLDIDERAYQLAYFALMMKSRSHDRRFFTRKIEPQVYCPKGYADGEEYGSLLHVDELEEKPETPEVLTLFDLDYDTQLNAWNFRRLLNQKYDVVVTNPPYMTNNSMPPKIKQYVNKYFEKGKRDLFSSFILKSNIMVKNNGIFSVVTIQTWMFLSSFEELRESLINGNQILSMLHLGAGAFEDLNAFNVLATALCVRKLDRPNLYYKAKYVRLVDYVTEKEKEYININNHFSCNQNTLNHIPGKIFLYWLSENMTDILVKMPKISQYYKVKPGMTTSDNAAFLRMWQEIDNNKMQFGCKSIEESVNSGAKWFPYNKGGNFRKWYGNNEFVIDWENDGYNIKQYKLQQREKDPKYNIGIAALNDIFKKGLTYSIFGFENFAVRYKNYGFLFDVSGASIFPNEDEELYLIAYLCSNVAFAFLKSIAPTVNFQAGNILDLPMFIDESRKSEIDTLALKCIGFSIDDWDDFEESWDFKKHPLIVSQDSLEESYNNWEELANGRYEKLRANEERINELFIESYNLKNDVPKEVVDRDIALRRADKTRDVKSFISYAVGCMFGRYSLDVDGLAYAGGEFDSSKYTTFIPDTDNIIPICDDEYFEDDIVGRFVDFVKVVYGEDTLEQNLDFIAGALSGKGTPREVIRNYFVKDFYNDHVKTYSKRPIYWQFDSGKKNGFKALIYMHRYESDLLARIRTDYVHEQQERYRTQIEQIEDMLVTATPSEKTKLTKKHKTLLEQSLEILKYEEKIHHLADQNISIDLDDGVVKNYAIFSDVVSKIK